MSKGTCNFSLLYSWLAFFPLQRAHSLAGSSNNKTVSRQMPSRSGQHCAKTMTSHGKQFTVTHEMLTAVARDQRWPDIVAGISARFSKFAFVFVLLSGYNKIT